MRSKSKLSQTTDKKFFKLEVHSDRWLRLHLYESNCRKFFLYLIDQFLAFIDHLFQFFGSLKMAYILSSQGNKKCKIINFDVFLVVKHRFRRVNTCSSKTNCSKSMQGLKTVFRKLMEKHPKNFVVIAFKKHC